MAGTMIVVIQHAVKNFRFVVRFKVGRFVERLSMLFLVGVLSLFSFAQASTDSPSASVAVCDDEHFWPPYTFQKEGVISGAMIETVDAIFKRLDMSHELFLVPWKRCLYQVEHFSGDPPLEIFINGSYSEERAEKYLVSDSVYSSGNAYFYSKNTFNAPPKITSVKDLRDYSVCGVLGFNYQMYQIKSSQLKVTANDLHAAFRLLESGRCDVILNAYSVPYGSLFTDEPMMNQSIEGRVFEDLPHQTFHIFISKASPRANQLLNQINNTLQALRDEGVVDHIFRKYLPECGAEC